MPDAPYDVCTCCARPFRLLDSLLPEYAKALHRGFRATEAVCRECIPHQGSDFRAVGEHRRDWPILLDAVESAHAQEVARLKADIAKAEAETAEARRLLQLRPERVVEKYVDADKLRAAEDEADRAFRSRERAWGALCVIRLQHRDMGSGRCRCGLVQAKCATARLLRDSFPMLDRWERDQARRIVERLPHGLPADHPAVLSRHVAQRLAATGDPYDEDDLYSDEFLQAEGAQPEQRATDTA